MHILAPEWCPATNKHCKGVAKFFLEQNTTINDKSAAVDLSLIVVFCSRKNMATVDQRNYEPLQHHCKGALAHMSAGIVPRDGNQIGARKHMGTGMVPKYIWAPKECPGLHWHHNGA